MLASWWTDERVEQLTKLWSQGLSAATICVTMGAPSRNAVISKIHRIGLPTRLKVHPQITRRTPVRKPIEKHVGPSFMWGKTNAEEPQQSEPDLVIPLAERKSLLDLGPHDCRWPIGNPQEPEFHFCNRKQVGGASYCEFHLKRSLAPLPPGRSEAPLRPSPRPESTPSKVREREDA